MEHGFVKLNADLKRGDELRVKCGAVEGLRGISIAKLGAQPGC
jgi:hypothetical protein